MKKNLCFRIRCISKKIRDILDNSSVYKDNEHLTNMAGWIIGYLYSRQSIDTYQKDIEQEFHINKSTASELLQVMEDNDFIRREVSITDRRLKMIFLTKTGLKIHENVIATSDEIAVKALDGFSTEEKEMFNSFLSRVEKNLEGETK